MVDKQFRSLALTIIVFPVASAGATLAANNINGTLKDVIPQHTPNGSCRTICNQSCRENAYLDKAIYIVDERFSFRFINPSSIVSEKFNSCRHIDILAKRDCFPTLKGF
jgi:hypothetical protein